MTEREYLRHRQRYGKTQTSLDFLSLNRKFAADNTSRMTEESTTYQYLQQINSPADLRKIPVQELAFWGLDGTKKVVILDQPVAVAVPSDVAFVSDEGTSVETGNRIRIENAVESYIIY